MKAKKIKWCIGLLTCCDSQKMPERFEILKKAVDSLELVKREDVFIYCWDNNSSDETKDFLKSKPFIDEFYFSKKNLYDVVAVHCLAEKARSLGAKYVSHLEDDFLFYNDSFHDACFDFLEQNKDCGYLRVLKYDFNKKFIYDKFGNYPKQDKENCQRHFNQITKEKLRWIDCGDISGFSFYKNNWHWYNYFNICNYNVFNKIIPKRDHKPLMPLEGFMMDAYHSLGLSVGIMDKGIVTHIGQFTAKTSQRLNKTNNQTKKLPIIRYEEVLEEIKKYNEFI